MRSVAFEFRLAMVGLIGAGCSSDVGDVAPIEKPVTFQAESQVTYREVLVFPALPIVDDSEVTLKLRDILELRDKLAVLSESIGIEVAGGVTDNLLTAGALIPVQKLDTFSTVTDGQEELTLTLVRGKSKRVSENQIIGKIGIVGISPAPAGTPRIALLLKVQRNGDIIVSASEQSTEKPLRLKLL